MGGDGGSIPKREELVRNQKKREKIERNVENSAKWKHCTLSQQPLEKPVVACKLGRLYNKERVIELLLDRKKFFAGAAAHIRSLKDVKELQLADSTTANDDISNPLYVCPVSGIDVNGINKFVFSWKCGCLVSEKALKLIGQSKIDKCLYCNKPCKDADIVKLYPTTEEEAIVLENMGIRAKANKRKSNIRRQEEAKEPKIDNSLQTDPSKTDVYKSLFTTSEAAINQPKAHWVTHNPLYY